MGLKRHDWGKGSPNKSKKVKEIHPWSGRCSEPCWNAAGIKCTCRCGGKHHGKGTITKDTKKLIVIDELGKEPVPPSSVRERSCMIDASFILTVPKEKK